MSFGGHKRAVVIGAGVAGLAAGYGLSGNGWDVLVLEKQEEVGGRCRTTSQGGFHFDTGAQYFRDSYDSVLKTAISVGMGARLRLPQAGKGIYHRGEVSSFLPRSTNPLKILPWSAIGLLGPLDLPLISMRFFGRYRSYNIKYPLLWTSGDDLTASEFLSARASRGYRRSFAEPLVEYAWGAGVDRVSAAAFMVALRLTFGDRTGTFTGGVGSFPAALASRLTVKTGMEAVEILGDRSVSGVRARPGGDGRARSYRADLVVCTAPAPLVRGLTGRLGRTAGSVADGVEYTEELVVNVGIPQETFEGVGQVLLPAEEGFRASWLCTQVSKADEYSPGDSTLLTVVFSGREAFHLMDASDESVMRVALEDAERVLDRKGLTTSVFRVDRHEMGRPVISPGYVERLRRLKDAGSGVKNLLLAGDWTSSPTVEGAVASGFAAARTAGSAS